MAVRLHFFHASGASSVFANVLCLRKARFLFWCHQKKSAFRHVFGHGVESKVATTGTVPRCTERSACVHVLQTGLSQENGHTWDCFLALRSFLTVLLYSFRSKWDPSKLRFILNGNVEYVFGALKPSQGWPLTCANDHSCLRWNVSEHWFVMPARS